jgi:hypothetical protein
MQSISKSTILLNEKVIKITISSENSQKSIKVDPEQQLWFVKLSIIEKLSNPISDAINWGLYITSVNDAEKKFLDDSRCLSDYTLPDNVLKYLI